MIKFLILIIILFIGCAHQYSLSKIVDETSPSCINVRYNHISPKYSIEICFDNYCISTSAETEEDLCHIFEIQIKPKIEQKND